MQVIYSNYFKYNCNYIWTLKCIISLTQGDTSAAHVNKPASSVKMTDNYGRNILEQ